MNACKPARILVVEDVPSLAQTYAHSLRPLSSSVAVVGDGAAALEEASVAPQDVVILDVNLPDMSGLDVLRELRTARNPPEVIVVTGEGSIRLAVDAMRGGARDFLVKPFTIERLRQAAGQAMQARNQLVSFGPEARSEPPAWPAEGTFSGFIGESDQMRAVYRFLERAAPSNATVFISGESGVGKEVCAHALHRLSKRSAGPFVVINCAAIPRDLLESEIFGHVKGAFTGALADRRGAALLAHGGTLFLDEICEMDVGLQAKLLRFLQDRMVRRVGEDSPRPADVRIVCATNRDPFAEVAAGRFREDLLYRLHVVPVELPPLRERGDDVLLIAREFLERFAREDGKSLRVFTPEAEAALLSYHWPGNVRQLQNVIRSAVVLNDGEAITLDMLPANVRRAQAAPAAAHSAPSAEHRECPGPARVDQQIRPLETVIRETIEQAIARCGGSIPKAAAALTVSPSTLYRRIQAWEAERARV
ncbi:MAG: sigma-54-dependent transcriptional regulator [Beijerinckiaceae bacterium]